MIQTGQTGDASDFIAASAGAVDAGKVPKLGSDGQLDKSFISKHVKFGGKGTDGALVIASGTTNIDLGGAAIFIKNYSSISITGTGKLTFSNPHANGTEIILNSQGDVTLTSSTVPMIEISQMGGQGTAGACCFNQSGSIGQGGYWDNFLQTGGLGFSFNSNEVAGKPATLNTHILPLNTLDRVPCGAGGSGSSAFNGGSGGYGALGRNGGNGGGSLDIRCGGALTFTGTIWAKAGGQGTTGNGNAGGNAGGGYVRMLYNSLISNTGSIVVTAESTGAGSAPNGAYLIALNTEFV